MLTSENSGKYLSRKYAEERERCARDKSQFTAAQQEFLEISTLPHSGEADKDYEALKFYSSPVDVRSNRKRLDIRNDPAVGF